MTGEGADGLATTQSSFDLLFNWTPGADHRAALGRLEEEFGEVVTDKPPSDVVNLERVTAIPRALGVFLGGLALLAVGHTVLVTVRRRHRELAVLKALGLRPRQVADTVRWQATLMIGTGLLLGVPLGIAVGIWSWTVVTSAMGLDNQPEVPLAAVAVTIIVALALVNLVALVPARSGARTQTAKALRAE
jgi:ABC-type antimicrobial peptide transport system permease subunit